MYTQCPECQTVFGVSKKHLYAARGRVRCGHCQIVFNANDHLYNNLNELEAKQSNNIPDDDIEHIDLAAVETPDIEAPTPEPEESAPRVQAEETEESADHIEFDEPAAEPVRDVSDNPELDAIFAALDSRLEQLADKAGNGVTSAPLTDDKGIEPGNKDYTDDFNHASDDDIAHEAVQAIFAAAEAELVSTDIDPDVAADSETDDDIDEQLVDLFAEADAELTETPEAENEFNDADEPAPPAATADLTLEETDGQATDSFVAEDIAVSAVAEENGPEDEDKESLDFISTDEKDDKKTEALFSELSMPGEIPVLRDQEELPFVLRNDIEEFHNYKPRSTLATMGMILAAIMLVVLLAAQMAVFRNVELANKLPQLKPYLSIFCQHLPCRFTGRRDARQIQLVKRDVRSHPRAKNALLISAIFVNQADYNQPYPDILIKLSDLTATMVVERRFKPQDYLAKDRREFQMMKPGVPVQVSLEVLDPGNDAVNFEFSFL